MTLNMNYDDPEPTDEEKTAWAAHNKPKPIPYRVRRVAISEREHFYNLVEKLGNELNKQAEDHYHPIKIHPHDYHNYRETYAYTIIFYYMPNGPAFTPPF